MSHFLFAYGTLQAGLAPPEIAPLVDHLRSLGDGSLLGTLYDLGTYPGLVIDSSAADPVYGTVYELPDDPRILRALDDYEGFSPEAQDSSLFVRRTRVVTLRQGTKLNCWVYIYNRSPGSAKIVANGRFAKGAAGSG
jgi:gamma-glutamylcyclotransferase (GGCT)/AIG2-like uncharacterized protein YtfP